MIQKNIRIKKMSIIAFMSAISAILMYLDFQLPFAPSFLKFDLSDVPAIFVGFFLEPLSGVLVILLKIILRFIFKGTSTMFVGEIMSFVCGTAYVLPASLGYRKMHTKKGACYSLLISIIVASVVAVIINKYIAFPAYGKLYGMTMEKIIAMASKVLPIVKNENTLFLYSVFPFNLVKYSIVSLITFLIYKKMSAIMHKFI